MHRGDGPDRPVPASRLHSDSSRNRRLLTDRIPFSIQKNRFAKSKCPESGELCLRIPDNQPYHAVGIEVLARQLLNAFDRHLAYRILPLQHIVG